MKIFLTCFFVLFLISSGYSEINLDTGITTGIEQNLYDAKEESFKAKFQYGIGFNTYIRLVLIRLIGIEFGFPGFFYTFGSDTIGDYYYAEKIKIPWNIKLVVLFNYKKLNFEVGGGFNFPYYILATYYSPRYMLLGISIPAGISYQITEKLSLGLRFETAFYNDEYSYLNNSIYYMLNLNYRIF